MAQTAGYYRHLLSWSSSFQAQDLRRTHKAYGCHDKAVLQIASVGFTVLQGCNCGTPDRSQNKELKTPGGAA